jgi:hypothetical protein
MRIKFFKIKLLCLAILGQTYANAQNASISNYLNQADNHAEIFNGRIEQMYHPSMFRNVPYFVNSEFTEVTIVYRGNYYPNLQARLDLYREQLVVLSGRQPIAIHSQNQNVNRVYIHGRTFVWLTPPRNSGLDAGFYMLLMEGDSIQLFGRERYILRRNLQHERVIFEFNHEVRFFLRHNDEYQTMRNRRSFTRLFPEHRREINNFSRRNRLNFGQNRAESLTAIAVYSEQLINSTNTNNQ